MGTWLEKKAPAPKWTWLNVLFFDAGESYRVKWLEKGLATLIVMRYYDV